MPLSPRLLRPRAAASTAFDPRVIAGLAQWHDAADRDSVTLTSGFVSQWSDKSGNGRHATQTVANNRPSVTTAGQNGLDIVAFDGANDGLEFTGVSRSDETWFFVARNTGNAERRLVSDASSGYGIWYTGISPVNITTAFASFAIGTGRIAFAYSAQSPANGPLIVCVSRSSNNYVEMRVDGVSVGTVTSNTARTMDRFGYFSPSVSQLNGFIAEIACYNRALSASEIQTVERYLSQKWAIALR